MEVNTGIITKIKVKWHHYTLLKCLKNSIVLARSSFKATPASFIAVSSCVLCQEIPKSKNVMTSQPCVVQLRLYQKRLTVSPWEKRWYCCCFVKIFKIAHLTKITATHIVAVKQGCEDVTKFEEPLILTASTCAHCVVGGEVINHRVQASVTLGGVEKVCVLVNVWVHGWNKVLVWFSLIIHRLTSPVRFGNEGGPWMTFQQWNLSVCGCLSPMGRVGKGALGLNFMRWWSSVVKCWLMFTYQNTFWSCVPRSSYQMSEDRCTHFICSRWLLVSLLALLNAIVCFFYPFYWTFCQHQTRTVISVPWKVISHQY